MYDVSTPLVHDGAYELQVALSSAGRIVVYSQRDLLA